MADKKIGKISHYYDKIGVAVVKLSKGDLKVGDKVKLVTRDGTEFTQEVSSMQIERANIDIAKSGDEFGLKVDKEVKENSDVIKTG
ncbi:hypothetical protein HYU92_04010 [Candidatus Curtissbacteria bacterium]|nr:hypothetical protein [Candidatus Curtissbacteria bacterium]